MLTKNRLIILILVVVFGVGLIYSLSYCSKSEEKDKFIGIWYDERGNNKTEIVKVDSKNYNYQTYSAKNKKGMLYKNGFISEEGYLLFDINNKFYGFEYKNKNEIMRITLYKPDVSSKPVDCEKKENWLLIRGTD